MEKLFDIDRLRAKSLTKQICDGFGVSMIVSSAVVKQLGREGLVRSRPELSYRLRVTESVSRKMYVSCRLQLKDSNRYGGRTSPASSGIGSSRAKNLPCVWWNFWRGAQ